VLAKTANKQYLLINLSLSPVLALFMSYFVKYYEEIGVQSPRYTFYENFNIPVYFFMSVVVALFVGLIVSAEEIFRDRKILQRERFLHLSHSSYLISKIAVLFTISAVQTLTFIVVGNSMLEIPLTEMRYWLLLFSCSCFANLLGLNISSAFDSAVTIYILIPVLVIPQLIMSGVVVNFDKFNPSVGKPNGVPIMGEFMASRWAFEAFMVTQFKDNPYERMFYDYAQEENVSKYKRDYLVTELQTKLAEAVSQRQHWRDVTYTPLVNTLDLLRNEINYELDIVGHKYFTGVDSLRVGQFDSTVYFKTKDFLIDLKRHYGVKLREAQQEQQKLKASMTDTPEKEAFMERMHLKYENKAVKNTVENASELNRIIEWKGRLIQKYYPIYFQDHHPRNLLDFQAPFFSPTKHFMGMIFDTFYFNLSVIWVMTIILYVALYFDGLKKLVHGFKMRRKYRTMKV
jgi:hypothetical protein